MFFGNEPAPTSTTSRLQKIAKLEKEESSSGAYLRHIAVGRIETRRGKYFVVPSKNKYIEDLIVNSVESIHKTESVSVNIEYESRDHGVFLYNIFTTVEFHGCDARILDRVIDRYQEVFPPLFSQGKIPDGISILDQSALSRITNFAGASSGKASVADVSLCGSYADFFAVFLEKQPDDFSADAGKCYKIKPDQQSIDIEYANGKNSRVISSYSIFGLVTDDPGDAYLIFKEMVFHVNYHWNLIRDLRDGVQRRFVNLIAEDTKTSELVHTIKHIDRQSDLIRALIYEADSISVCEWAEERDLYQSLWSGWKGDELVGATSGFVEDVKSSVSRRYDEKTSRYEGMIQFMLMFITFLTIASTVFQTVEFFYSSSSPSTNARQYWISSMIILQIIIIGFIYMEKPHKR